MSELDTGCRGTEVVVITCEAVVEVKVVVHALEVGAGVAGLKGVCDADVWEGVVCMGVDG